MYEGWPGLCAAGGRPAHFGSCASSEYSGEQTLRGCHLKGENTYYIFDFDMIQPCWICFSTDRGYPSTEPELQLQGLVVELKRDGTFHVFVSNQTNKTLGVKRGSVIGRLEKFR